MNAWWSAGDDPLSSPAMAQKVAQLRSDPGNQPLREEIRQLDIDLRAVYFRRQAIAQTGGWVMLLAGGLFLLSTHLAVNLGRSKHVPPVAADEGVLRISRIARTAVIAGGLLLVVGAGVFGFVYRPWAPPLPIPKAAPAAIADGAEFLRQWKANWPRFRGPDGSGVSNYANVPLEWDGPSGRNILWKSPVDMYGTNSPVVWGDKVFLAGAQREASPEGSEGSGAERRQVYCYDARSGKLLWTHEVKDVPKSPGDSPDVMEDTSFAAPTVCCDGQQVYAIFANLDLVCLDMQGNRKWARNLGPAKIHYGYAASLALAVRQETGSDGSQRVARRLLVGLDQEEADAGANRLLAIDVGDGRNAWEVKRPVDPSWSTPIVIETAEGPQIITYSNPFVIAYNFDGEELWRVRHSEGTVEAAASPIFAAGMVVVANYGGQLMAIRPDGRGDTTATHVAWKEHEDDSVSLPDTASSVSDGKLLFMLPSNLLTCIDMKTGRKLWEKSLEGSFQSSLSIAGDKIMATANNVGDAGLHGVTYVAAVGTTVEQFRILHTNVLGEKVVASPAFADGRIYIRGDKHLFCIGQKTASSLPATAPGSTMPATSGGGNE